MCRIRRGMLVAVVVIPLLLGAALAGVVTGATGARLSPRAALAWAAPIVGTARHSVQSDHFVLVWGSRGGVDLSTVSGGGGGPHELLERLERYYALDVRTAGVVTDARTLARDKIAVVLTRTSAATTVDAWAQGAVSGDLGTLEVAPEAVRTAPWDVARALADTLLGLGNRQTGAATPLGVMTSAFLATLAEPRAAGEPETSLRAANLRWASVSHLGGGWPLLQYAADRDGVAVLGRLWRASRVDEDPLETYRRVSGISAQELGRRVGEFAEHSITGDYSSGTDLPQDSVPLDPALAASFTTPLEAVGAAAGHFQVPSALAPAAGGFSVMQLVPAEPGGTVRVRARGHAEVDPTSTWTSGFVAVRGGVARYGALAQGADAELAFVTRTGEDLYLVVAATPEALPAYNAADGYPQALRYPFELRVVGASPPGSQPGWTRPAPAEGGHWHVNGGGWVSDQADVAASVYVGEQAVVGRGARLSGDVRVEGRAVVEGGAVLSGHVVVRDVAVVRAGAVLDGDVVVGGDAAVALVCSSGTYLRYAPDRTCDGLSPDTDVNVDQQPFDSATMTMSDAPVPRATPTPTATASSEAPSPVLPTTRSTPSEVAPPPPVAAAPACTAAYVVVNTWPGGYQAQVTVTAGAQLLTGWKVSWTLPSGQTVGNIWGATLATSGSAATATSMSWNSQLGAGATATFGVTGSAAATATSLTASCGRGG
jgi:hypothetical protein